MFTTTAVVIKDKNTKQDRTKKKSAELCGTRGRSENTPSSDCTHENPPVEPPSWERRGRAHEGP